MPTRSFPARSLRQPWSAWARNGLRLLLALMLSGPLQATAAPEAVRVATLKYGTLNWELTTIAQQKIDRANGFELQVLPMAGMTATRTALASGAADVVVADWIWVSRQRDLGSRLQFLPYSSSIGKLMLARDSDIRSLQDLRGKKLGIAGGPVDKSWLLLRALGLSQGVDLQRETEQKYGAPPLLNAALERGQLDAVVTFWHYAARLEGQGHPVLYDLKDVSRELGLNSEMPMLGYVFHQDWAEQHPDLVAALQRASGEAKRYLQEHETAWQSIRPLMNAEDEAVFLALKNGFLEGKPGALTDRQLEDAREMFALLVELGGRELAGDSQALDPATFWQPH